MAQSPNLRLIGEGRKRKAAFEAEQIERARVEELTSFVNAVVAEKIVHGKNGERGPMGPQGPQGEIGPQGVPGPKGADGLTLTEVVHTYEELPEDLPKKEEIESLKKELDGLKRYSRFAGIGGGSGEGVKYVSIKSSLYKISSNELLTNGITIFGVNYAGPVSITLPQPKPGQIVYINDESGNADSNNITVTTLQ